MTSRRCLVCARQRARRWHESLGGVASSNDWSHRLQSSWSQYEETLASQILIWQQSWAACHIPLLLLLLLLLLRDDEEDEDVDDDDDDADFLLLPISFRRQHIRPIYLCRWLHASHVINWADDRRQTQFCRSQFCGYASTHSLRQHTQMWTSEMINVLI